MQRAWLGAGGAIILTPTASACPGCALGQAVSTLVYVAAFMLIPYVIVSGVCMWMRSVVKSEDSAVSEEGLGTGPKPPQL